MKLFEKKILIIGGITGDRNGLYALQKTLTNDNLNVNKIMQAVFLLIQRAAPLVQKAKESKTLVDAYIEAKEYFDDDKLAKVDTALEKQQRAAQKRKEREETRSEKRKKFFLKYS